MIDDIPDNSYRDKEAYRVAYLIAGYVGNTLTEAEHEELDDWVCVNDENMKLFEDLTDERNIEANIKWLEQVPSANIYEQLQQSGRFEKPKGKDFRLIWRTAAAAAIILLCVFFAQRYINYSSSKNGEPELVKNAVLQPGGNRATLTLPDGSVIDLTTAKNGILSGDGIINVSKQNENTLVYQEAGKETENEVMHILATPLGGQFQVTLQDGTKVWLNAASTLRYPAVFTGEERKVELTGEAYFEVSHSAKHPFKVALANSDTVSVLGTHFNIQDYPDEKEKAITLVEGKVLVQHEKNKTLLIPGMQAVINGNATNTTENVNIEEIIGWKDGLFVFRDASIEKIMSQVARWYNAEIVYKGNISQQFNATIHRSEPLSKLLHLLELNGYVKFKTENNIIYVSP